MKRKETVLGISKCLEGYCVVIWYGVSEVVHSIYKTKLEAIDGLVLALGSN